MFWLSKGWQDPEDGIELVSLRWTMTMLGREPDWRRVKQTVVMVPQQGTTPVQRRCSIWVPAPPFLKRLLPDDPHEEVTGFLFHSFCEVVQRGRLWSTQAEAQEIRAVSVSHADPSSACTDACLYYSLLENEELQPLQPIHRVPMILAGSLAGSLDGVAATEQFLPLLPLLPDTNLSDKDLDTRSQREEVIAGLPPPHNFQARLWGPKNARILYAVHFYQQGVYNPFREGGYWLLNNGSPWTLTL